MFNKPRKLLLPNYTYQCSSLFIMFNKPRKQLQKTLKKLKSSLFIMFNKPRKLETKFYPYQ